MFAPRHGHFLLESGHHGKLWMDLEATFVEPARVEPAADEIASRLIPYRPEIICGPLVEGAFLGLMVSQRMGIPFTYSERFANADGGLYPFAYRIPKGLHRHLRGKRVAIVNDVINAGSAVRGTIVSLEDLGATSVAIGAMLVLGDWSRRFASEKNIVLEAVEAWPNELWAPAECPLCAAQVPLERPVT